MEGHMVHFKSEFKNKAEALKHEGGVCCVAFMLQVSLQKYPNLNFLPCVYIYFDSVYFSKN